MATANPLILLVATALAAFWVAGNAAAAAAALLALGLASLPGFIILGASVRWRQAGAVAALLGIGCTLSIAFALALVIRPLPPLAALLAANLAALAWRLWRGADAGSRPLSPAPRDDGWLGLVAPLAALLLAAGPIGAAGTEVGETIVFRAYFNADFFKHLAYAQASASGFPPGSPFDPGRPANYYVGFHLLPAAALRLAAWFGTTDPLAVLKTSVLVLAPLFGGALFGAARAFGAGTGVAAFAATAALLGPNLKWLAMTPSLFGQGVLMNVEGDRLGIGATGSSLLRLLFYVPPHELALAMLCAWIALFPPRAGDGRAHAGCSMLLVLPSLAVSAIVGAWFALLALVMAAGRRDIRLFVLTLCAALVGAAVPPLIGMIGAVASAATDPFLSMRPVETLSLTRRLWAGLAMPLTLFGGLGLLALAESLRLLTGRHPRRERIAAWLLLLLFAGLVAAEFAPVPRLSVELRLKTSFVAWVFVAIVVGLALQRSGAGAVYRGFRIVCLLIAAIGLGTPLYDLAWHLRGEEYTAVPAGEWRLLQEIRTGTSADARIQEPLEPPYLLGGSDMLVPVLAGRSPAVATRSPWLTGERAKEIDRLFDVATPARQRAALAGKLGIDALLPNRRGLDASYDALVATLGSQGWHLCADAGAASLWLPPQDDFPPSWTMCRSEIR